MVKKYIKRPEEIKALEWNGKNQDEIHKFCKSCYCNAALGILRINSPEGILEASQGDYVVEDTDGWFYLCKPDLFKVLYSEVKKSEE
jgi:hypothetical protein